MHFVVQGHTRSKISWTISGGDLSSIFVKHAADHQASTDHVLELPPKRIGPQDLPSLLGCPPVWYCVRGCRIQWVITTYSNVLLVVVASGLAVRGFRQRFQRSITWFRIQSKK